MQRERRLSVGGLVEGELKVLVPRLYKASGWVRHPYCSFPSIRERHYSSNLSHLGITSVVTFPLRKMCV